MQHACVFFVGFLFFFSSSRNNRALHSFPTRRSSDLSAATRSGFRLIRSRSSSPPQASSGRTRSEEHTSELQSRSDLVCRLLLEKKTRQISRKYLVRHFHTISYSPQTNRDCSSA